MPFCLIPGWRPSIALPAYLQQSELVRYDLTAIVPKDDLAGGSNRQQLLEQLAAVDMSDPDGFPLEALQQLTTLDRVQAEAIKVAKLPVLHIKTMTLQAGCGCRLPSWFPSICLC